MKIRLVSLTVLFALPVLADEEASPAKSEVASRHFGLSLATGPGNVMFDIDYKPFYGFVAGSTGYPIILLEEGYFGAAVGVGATWQISRASRWQFDLFADAIPVSWKGVSVGVGIGAGFHYTFDSGFTVTFKVPVFGAALGSSMGREITKGAEAVGLYYLDAAMQLPIASIGYRF